MSSRITFFAAAFVLLSGFSARAYELTYQNMLLATIKLDPSYDYENFVESYMQAFRPAVWQRSHNDEFEFNGKKAETLDMMKKAAASFNLDEPLVIHTNIQFGEYDFKKHEFALNPFSDTSFFPVGYCCNTLPSQIRLFFENSEIINGLPMEEQAARSFLNLHKQYGNVNRQLVADVSIRLKSLKSEGGVVGEIVKVVIRDPMNKNAVIRTLPEKTGS